VTIKVTLELLQERRAWTEAHYAITAATFADAAAPATNLGILRAACCGNKATLTGIRLSEVPANRVVDDVPFPGPYGGTWPSDPTNLVYDSAFGNMALLFSMTGLIASATAAPPKHLYLAGLPVETFQVGAGGGDDFTLTGPVNAAVSAYLNYLAFAGQQYWGYRTRSNLNRTQAQGLVTNALTPVQIGVVAPTLPGVVAGSEVFLTGWKRTNTRIQGLEGAFRVASVTTAAGPPSISTYYLFNTGNVSPLNFNDPGFITPLSFQFAAYQSWDPVKTVTRKRGGSLNGPRGRSRVRI
jgi:hypothetical protein